MNHDVATNIIEELKNHPKLDLFLDDLKSWLCEENDHTIDITIAFDDENNWTYQTGDNSYTGSAYSYPHWLVTSIDQDTTPQNFIENLEFILNQYC